MIHWRTWLGIAWLLLAGNPFAHAHDPYEITATGNVLSNRLELSAVFEYRAARLLAGRGWPTNQINEAEEFQGLKPALEDVARTFFSVTAGGRPVAAASVSAALGVENHVTLTVTFARTTGPLTVAAPGLAPLGPEGQYGVGLTMLDMVGKKVLGQHVFGAANPQAVAEFASATESIIAETHPVIQTTTNLPLAANGERTAAGSATPASRPILWPWFLAAAIGIVVLWLGKRRR